MAGKNWTKEEVEFLKENYLVMGYSEIGKVLNRSKLSVSNKLTYLNHFGLKKKKIENRVDPEYRKYVSIFQLPNEMQQIIIGSLLGDSHVANKLPWNCCLEEDHSTKQGFYAQWKAEILKPLGAHLMPPRQTSLGYFNVRFYTGCLPMFTDLRETVYKNGYTKNVYVNALEKLDPLGLAVWMMDDGYWNRGSIKLCTDSFSVGDCEKLQIFLRERFGLDSTFLKYNNQLQFRRKPTGKLVDIIEPYILEEFRYKIGQ